MTRNNAARLGMDRKSMDPTEMKAPKEFVEMREDISVGGGSSLALTDILESSSTDRRQFIVSSPY